MTVAVNARSIDYAEDGVTVAFPVPWRFNTPTDIKAQRTAIDGTVTTLAYGAGYAVTGGDTDAGGELTVTAPGAAGGSLSIWSETSRAQTADYVQSSTFPAETHEQRLDNLAMVDQEQDREIGRSVRVPRGEQGFVLDPVELRQALPFALFDAADGRLTAASADRMADALIAAILALLGSAYRGNTGAPGIVTANSGVQTTGWTTDVGGSGATSAWHALSPPVGPFTNSAGGDDRVRASLIANVGRFNQGPTGHATYYDTVIAFGLNMTQAYVPQNTAMPSASYRIESKFAQGGPTDVFAVEFHTSMHSNDAVPVEFRTFSAFVPHKKADWAQYAGNTLRGGQLSLMDGSISPDISGHERVKFDFRPGNNVINISKNGAERAPGFSWDSNNVYVCRQINAAGNAFVSLPYVDASDAYMGSAASSTVGAIRVDPTFGLRSLYTEFGLSPAAGDTFRFSTINGNIVGNYTASRFDANVSGDLKWELNNTGAGKTIFDLTSSGGTVEYRAQGVKVVGARGAAVPDAAGGATVDVEARAAINALLARLRAATGHGLIA